jgi:hypothetical protein
MRKWMYTLSMIFVLWIGWRPPVEIGPPPAIAPCVGDPVSMPKMCFPR